MEKLLAGLVGGGGGAKGKGAVDKAQQVMYDAWEAETREQAVELALRALEISGDCADAYVVLAEELATTLDESVELYRQGFAAGERALGKKAFKEDVGYFWGLLETRPYMRARAGLAQCLWALDHREEAIGHYWGLLELNPNDNQGIRAILMPCLIQVGRDEDGERLHGRYKEDGMAVWMYSRALLDFRKNGNTKASMKLLKAALKENKNVPPYLIGRRKMPRDLPDYYGFGDENEAILYVHGNLAAWEASPGAIQWLTTTVK